MTKRINQIINSKAYRVIDRIIFLCLLATSAVAMFVLFYRQATTDTVLWPSDFKLYVAGMLGINEKDKYPYPIMFELAKLIAKVVGDPSLGLVITVVFFNVLAIVIVKVIIEKQTETKFLATFSTVCLFFLSMLYNDVFKRFGIMGRYIGVMSPNPWHNHTYMSARPFMILTFVVTAITLDSYERDFAIGNHLSKKDVSKYCFFSISLLLATMTKPSYTLVHMGAAGIIMLYRLIKNRFKTFRQTILLGLLYVPTIIDMLYQFADVFTGTAVSGEKNGIGIGLFDIWSQYSRNIPLSILLAIAFPIVVLCIHLNSIKEDTQYRLSWQIFLMGLLMQCVLYEKGPRAAHGNFFWGYICGLFLVFMTSVILLVRDTKIYFLNDALIKSKVLLFLQWAFLLLHTILGCYYFYILTIFGADYF